MQLEVLEKFRLNKNQGFDFWAVFISKKQSVLADKKTEKILQDQLKNSGFKWDQNQTHYFNCTEGLLAILGYKKETSADQIVEIAAGLAKKASELKLQNLVLDFRLDQKEIAERDLFLESFFKGIFLADYQFTSFKKPSSKTSLKKIILTGLNLQKKDATKVKKIFDLAKKTALSIGFARDLVNFPGEYLTPLKMGNYAKKIKGITTRLYKKTEIEKMKMGAFLGVAKGSHNPPVLIQMHYKPKKKAKKRLALVGKGITFDSGGLSLKPPKAMETMKMDMGGAAAVLGFMNLVADLKPDLEIIGIIAACENAIGPHAQRPGDVVKAMSGKTIEVLNTDAEGRLTLADALHFVAKKYKPDFIIDMATLTGACLVALGRKIAGLMGNNQKLIDQIIAASHKSGEKLWHLPLPQEYKAELKSKIADIKNIGSSFAGTLTAGLFLQEFVDNKTPWAHLDIAGPAWTEQSKASQSAGGTGFMVDTLKFLVQAL